MTSRGMRESLRGLLVTAAVGMVAFAAPAASQTSDDASLGRKLGRVEDLMRTGRHVRTARPEESVREVFVRLGGNVEAVVSE